FSAYIIRGIGMMPSLLLGTIAGSASHLSLAWLSESGGGHLDLRCCGQHRRVRLRFRAGRADQLHVDAHRDGICRQSIRASPGSILAGASGFVIAKTGFTIFFVLSSLIGMPVAALCWYVSRLHADLTPDPERHGSA